MNYETISLAHDGPSCVITLNRPDKRNAISVLMGVELILNSANINYVAFSHFSSGNADGQIYAIFVIMLAAAEAAVGLAIVLAIFQLFHTIEVEAAETLKE